jgi:hypothetical protein
MFPRVDNSVSGVPQPATPNSSHRNFSVEHAAPAKRRRQMAGEVEKLDGPETDIRSRGRAVARLPASQWGSGERRLADWDTWRGRRYDDADYEI